MSNKIIFTAVEQIYNVKEIQPVPSRTYIPRWFKDLKHKVGDETVKGCIPVLDSMTSGYLLRLSEDIKITFNKYDKKVNTNQTDFTSASKQNPNHYKFININHGNAMAHPIDQLGGKGCPYPVKNKNYPFIKICNPWKIITQPGYSCLFIPPMHRNIEHFNVLPGIVDTDKFDLEINFPILINSDKYPVFDVVFPKGLPYVQIIPFKREDWEMSIKSRPNNEIRDKWASYFTSFINKYKNKMWSKKSWK